MSDALHTFIESGALFILFVIVVLIACIREIVCWYWKINEHIALQNQQINLLVFILEHQDEEISILKEINNKLGNTNIEMMMNEAAPTKEDDPE